MAQPAMAAFAPEEFKVGNGAVDLGGPGALAHPTPRETAKYAHLSGRGRFGSGISPESGNPLGKWRARGLTFQALDAKQYLHPEGRGDTEA